MQASPAFVGNMYVKHHKDSAFFTKNKHFMKNISLLFLMQVQIVYFCYNQINFKYEKNNL